MPRTLPWLGGASAKQRTPRSTTSSPSYKRKRASPPDDLDDSDLNRMAVNTPERPKKRLTVRTPSTSPPPAPPDIEYMHEGYTGDDIWMMVEDEFFSTAKAFTQHIHHAEYVRLKNLAKSRGAGVLRDLVRPTDGSTEQSNGLKAKLEIAANSRRVRDAMDKIDRLAEDGEEEDDEYMQDPQLAGLMTSSQRSATVLTGVAKVKSNTRAAAGFKQSPHKEGRSRQTEQASQRSFTTKSKITTRPSDDHVKNEESWNDDDDGLEITPSPSSKLSPHSTRIIDRRVDKGGFEGNVIRKKGAKSMSIFKQSLKTAQEEKSIGESLGTRRTTRPEKADRELGNAHVTSPAKDSETARSVQSQAAADFVARRRIAREKKEQDQMRKAKRADDIPTFIV